MNEPRGGPQYEGSFTPNKRSTSRAAQGLFRVNEPPFAGEETGVSETEYGFDAARLRAARTPARSALLMASAYLAGQRRLF